MEGECTAEPSQQVLRLPSQISLKGQPSRPPYWPTWPSYVRQGQGQPARWNRSEEVKAANALVH